MKKSGFTIVELLAVIVIMAVIMSVGTVSFHIIADRIQETAFKNKQSYLEIAAVKYAEETGYLATNVNNLVELGYANADTENGEVLNPMNGEKLNCHIIRLHYDGHYFYATYTEEQQCDNEFSKNNVYLKIDRYQSSTEDGTYEEENRIEEENAWTNQNVILVANFLDINTSLEDVEKIIWRSNAEEIERIVNEENSFQKQNTFIVKAEQIIDTFYSVKVVMKDGTIYEAQAPVKIDKQGPMVFQEEIKVQVKEMAIGNANEVKIAASDGNGAGVASYYVGENANCNTVSPLDYIPSENSIYKTYVGPGVYYVCVKDKLGNLAEEESTKVIDLVHLVPPKLEVKENPLVLQSGDFSEEYLFKENILADYGIFEEAQISCNPTNAVNLSAYEVTCTALSTNGLSSTISFAVDGD